VGHLAPPEHHRYLDLVAPLQEILKVPLLELVIVLVDLRTFDAALTGKEAQEVLDRAGITCNRNTIPDDPRSPFVTSGLRFGTPAMTTTGMGAPEMEHVAQLIARTLRHRTDDAQIAATRAEVAELCRGFQPYGTH
jgi:glycine hydroxymethyltransferase